MIRRKAHFTATILLIWSWLASACTLIGIRSALPDATPTPLGDTLSFTMPAFAINLEPGDTVPGTRLQYIGRKGDAYEVSIDGLTAVKRTGDSFIWNGVLAPGVHASYNLRLVTAVFGSLPVAGPVRLSIFFPEPVAEALPDDLTGWRSFSNIVVSYPVPVGRQIPGTTLVYQGVMTPPEADPDTRLAELSGLSGYPYLALGDSLLWSGRLRDNVWVRYSLRVAAISEEELRVAGTAELWVR